MVAAEGKNTAQGKKQQKRRKLRAKKRSKMPKIASLRIINSGKFLIDGVVGLEMIETHNIHPCIQGLGSDIFFHGSGSGSAGKQIRISLRIQAEIDMTKKIYLYFR